MTEINELTNCPMCNQTLEDPVFLPCCHTVCKKHESEFAHSSSLKCPTCNVKHELPENGFPLNVLVKNLLDRLDCGVEQHIAASSYTYLKQLFEELERFDKDPESEISRVIDELKNEIDLRREILKETIDKEALDLIKRLEDRSKVLKANYGLNKRFASNRLALSDDIKKLLKSIKRKIPVWENGKNLKWKDHHVEMVSKCEQLYQESVRIKNLVFNEKFRELETAKKTFCQQHIESPLIKFNYEVEGDLKKIENCNHLRQCGFYLELQVSTQINSRDGKNYLTIHLKFKSAYCHFSEETLDIHLNCDLLIENSKFPERCFTKKEFDTIISKVNEPFTIGCSDFIKISELKANRELFDEEKQSFKIRVNINKFEWVKRVTN